MHNVQNTSNYNSQDILAIISGWKAQPRPEHRALEAEAMEMVDLAERDYAARQTFSGRAARCAPFLHPHRRPVRRPPAGDPRHVLRLSDAVPHP